MEIIIKHYRELTADELYDILQLRAEVFVVEQNCPYQDLDGKDKDAYHVWLRDERGVVAALRVYDIEGVHIGRVVTRFHRQGLGTIIMREGIRTARERYGQRDIFISAQQYARPFYEQFGFEAYTEGYLEDDIPHIGMKLSENK